MKLVQKRFFKDTREFEIGEEVVFVRIKGLLKEQKLTVSLSALEPEPVVNGTELEFYGKTQAGPLLSLVLNNPGVEEFDAFVMALRQKIMDEMTAFADEGGAGAASHSAPGWNVYDEPPDFEELQDDNAYQPVKAERLTDDVAMLKRYLDENSIKPFIDVLEKLIREPANEAVFKEMVAAFNALGSNQGAVLTYTTYLKVLLSKSIWS